MDSDATRLETEETPHETRLDDTTSSSESSEPPRPKSTLKPWVFWPATIIILTFVGLTMVAPDAMETAIGAVQSVLIANFSWWYVLLAFGLVVFCLYLGFSRTGRIVLGKPDTKPEFTTLSWLSLLFAAGMGIGLVFFGMTEPLMHFATPRPGVEAADLSEGALQSQALAQTYLHWGLQPWAIYAIVGLAIAHAIHRRGRPLSMRWAVEPLIGEKAARGPWGNVIDAFALTGTVFGVATSLGLGVTQMAAGLRSLGIVPQDSPVLEYVMIAVVTGFVIFSVLSGVNRGMKWLSNFNLALAAGLVIFLLIVGPTQFLLKEMVQTFGQYLQNFIGLSLDTSAFYGEAGNSWQASWSSYYWAWWMSWTPFVGVFIARISRGRTVREFMLGVLLVPSLISIVWFAVLGGTALFLEANRPDGYVSVIAADGSVNSNEALFQVLEQLPAGPMLVVGAILLSAIFFITSSDSGSLVMAMIATGGDPEPRSRVRVFFAVTTALLAAALLLAGGLTAIQTLAITIGLPFSILILLMAFAVLRALQLNVRRMEALKRQSFLAHIQDRFGLATDDDAQENPGAKAESWWKGLSREQRSRVAQGAKPRARKGDSSA